MNYYIAWVIALALSVTGCWLIIVNAGWQVSLGVILAILAHGVIEKL